MDFGGGVYFCRGWRFFLRLLWSEIIRTIRCCRWSIFWGWLFLPRFLIAYYVYVDAGTSNLWFWAYLILGIVGLMGESGFVHRRVIRRRTTVTRDGNTTTTVEEEEV